MKIISDESFESELKSIANQYDIELSDDVCKDLRIYKDLIIEWNKKINLTGITDNYEIIIKHFIDCLKLTKYIDSNKIIDIGTGAGFPGMVLAIYYREKKDITLLDALNKRIIFLNEVKEILKLNNVTIVNERAEEGAIKDIYREKYDIVIARAVAPLNILTELSVGFLKLNGKMLFMKGNNYNEEIENSKNAFNVLGCKFEKVYNYDLVTDETFERSIIEIYKKKNTESKYPRNYGNIKKKPL